MIAKADLRAYESRLVRHFSVGGRIQMRKLLPVLMLVILGSGAMAQNNKMGSSPNQGLPEAPVGHRQPRADQVPNEKNLSNPNDAVNREDARSEERRVGKEGRSRWS